MHVLLFGSAPRGGGGRCGIAGPIQAQSARTRRAPRRARTVLSLSCAHLAPSRTASARPARQEWPVPLHTARMSTGKRHPRDRWHQGCWGLPRLTYQVTPFLDDASPVKSRKEAARACGAGLSIDEAQEQLRRRRFAAGAAGPAQLGRAPGQRRQKDCRAAVEPVSRLLHEGPAAPRVPGATKLFGPAAEAGVDLDPTSAAGPRRDERAEERMKRKCSGHGPVRRQGML
jgi:hypothetical protein